MDKYAKAKAYCTAPFEILHKNGTKIQIPIRGERIGDDAGPNGTDKRNVSLNCSSATTVELPANSLDAVLTDPPYFSNVQYAELMDLLCLAAPFAKGRSRVHAEVYPQC